MKQWAWMLVIFAVTAVTARARLGETVDEIAKRYGKPTMGINAVDYIYRDYGDTQAWYEKDDLKILVVFKEKKSQYEAIAKQDSTKTLARSEIKSILDANANDSTWSAPREPRVPVLWNRDDGGARAALSADGKTLVVKVTIGGSKGF